MGNIDDLFVRYIQCGAKYCDRPEQPNAKFFSYRRAEDCYKYNVSHGHKIVGGEGVSSQRYCGWSVRKNLRRNRLIDNKQPYVGNTSDRWGVLS
jgi:hypothetical protein